MVRPPTAIAVNDRLRDLWVGGMSLARVAAAVGLSVADTEQILVSLGFDPRPPRRADAETNLRKLIEEGLSPADVATRLGMTERSVRSWMARAGIPQPRKPKQSAMPVQAMVAARKAVGAGGEPHGDHAVSTRTG